MSHHLDSAPTLDATVHYLHDALGMVPKVRPWTRASERPYFLQDAFELRELELLDRQILLAIDRQANKPALGDVRSLLDKVRAFAGHPVVYLAGALAS